MSKLSLSTFPGFRKRLEKAGSDCLRKFWLGISLACFVFSPNTNAAAANPLFSLSINQHKNTVYHKRYGKRLFFYCLNSAPWRRPIFFLWHNTVTEIHYCSNLSPGLRFELGPYLSKITAFHDKAFLGQESHSHTS